MDALDVNEKIASAFIEQGLDPNFVDELLSPIDIDTNNPAKVAAASNFVGQLQGIELDDLIALTNSTGMQIKYPVLLPLIRRQLREEPQNIPEEDIAKLRQAAQRARVEIIASVQPNYLAQFLDGIADEFVRNNRNVRVMQIVKIIALVFLVIAVAYYFGADKYINKQLKALKKIFS